MWFIMKRITLALRWNRNGGPVRGQVGDKVAAVQVGEVGSGNILREDGSGLWEKEAPGEISFFLNSHSGDESFIQLCFYVSQKQSYVYMNGHKREIIFILAY